MFQRALLDQLGNGNSGGESRTQFVLVDCGDDDFALFVGEILGRSGGGDERRRLDVITTPAKKFKFSTTRKNENAHLIVV